jgi:SAM-dependent methyltransferase
VRVLRSLLPHWLDLWPEIAASAGKGKVVHLGSGRTPLPGATTVDINVEMDPDVVWDLNRTPWPFEEGTFDGVVALSILEHLNDFLGVMAEIHRISKAGAVTSILVPHFSSGAAFVDPTHRQRLSARSCDYFIPGTALEREYGFYVPFRFELVERYVHLQGGLRYLPGAEWIAGRYSSFWEDYLCYLLRGGGVFWQLRAIK